MNSLKSEDNEYRLGFYGSLSIRDYAVLTDLDVVILTQNGDKIAFTELLRRYQRRVFSRLRKLAPDIQDHNDLAQEIFIRVWRSIHGLKEPQKFQAWLRQIITNVFFDLLRRRPPATISIDGALFDEDGPDGSTRQIADLAKSVEELAEQDELMDCIAAAYRDLPPLSQKLILMRDIQGMTYEAISLRTSTTLGTVKSQIHRARKRMRVMLGPKLGCMETAAGVSASTAVVRKICRNKKARLQILAQ